MESGGPRTWGRQREEVAREAVARVVAVRMVAVMGEAAREAVGARAVGARAVAVMGEAAREAVARHGLDDVRMAVAVAAEAASRARAAVRVRPPAGTLTRGHVAEHGPPVMRDTAEAQRGNGALDLGRVGGGGCVERA